MVNVRIDFNNKAIIPDDSSTFPFQGILSLQRSRFNRAKGVVQNVLEGS